MWASALAKLLGALLRCRAWLRMRKSWWDMACILICLDLWPLAKPGQIFLWVAKRRGAAMRWNRQA